VIGIGIGIGEGAMIIVAREIGAVSNFEGPKGAAFA
jgi:hypothetical protein